ncbi:MAG: Pr6Pr family membrane protein [Mycoplasmataceae bacterium]|nr:Pr6Pr family membrane protein [Mycoplasmataceae bacterium]
MITQTTKIAHSKKDIAVGFFASIYGVILLFIMINGVVSSIHDKGLIGFNFFYAFTNETNLFCGIWMIFLCVVCLCPKLTKLDRFIRNKVVMTSLCLYITMTFFIVALWLSPIWKGQWISNGIFGGGEVLFTHLLTPIVMWVIYFLVLGTGKINRVRLLYTLVYPILYVIMGLIVGYLTDKFPYDFINPNFYGGHTIGPIVFPLVILVLASIFYGVAWLLYKLKNFIDIKYHNKT